MTARDGRFLVGLIGAGIGTSLSPALHEREAGKFGLAYQYRLLDLDELGVPVGEVVAAARLAGFDGLNITHPVKQLVPAHLDALSPDAAALAAVNTVVFTGQEAIGHNTDLPGFARGLTAGLPDAVLEQVVVLGAGGAGAAVTHALLSLGARELRVFDVDHERAGTLVASLTARFGEGRATAEPLTALADATRAADGLVHATPTGMEGHPGLPLPADLLHPKLWVADVVYRPLDTELLIAARARGCRVLGGGRMAVFQAADSFRLFTGLEPDVERMLRHFDSLTTQGRVAAHAHR
ncbi:shikimate dehydrogenase [Amycolatopsis sp. MEPSY49]|uniref:shikimate dehydrogenase n=1 Tax=Amycolatopsis sp. MEPSY49 TaxID=3151600 RepID=UPI003EF3BEAA